jgi:hypothetical protein
LRDKIYGIRPLLSDLKLTLSGANYSKIAEEVFEQFSREFITNTESLWILGRLFQQINTLRIKRKQNLGHLPRWILPMPQKQINVSIYPLG